jgi:hypothetical protein
MLGFKSFILMGNDYDGSDKGWNLREPPMVNYLASGLPLNFSRYIVYPCRSLSRTKHNWSLLCNPKSLPF